MRIRIYDFLVNRHSGIRSRYHRIHEKAGIRGRLLCYAYLLWLNFCYYVLFCHFLDEPEEAVAFERKRLPVQKPESVACQDAGLSVDAYVECLSRYDIISFDLFDTLIFRPFSEPGDLFYFLGAELGLMDFKRIRMEQEALARVECFRKKGHYEAALSDIWSHIEQETGTSALRGMEAEQRLELELCYANPFMAEVYHRLQDKGKKIIVISDMYLPGEFLRELLERNGYKGLSGLYVSCEHGCGKSDGKLYELVRGMFGEEARLVHIGDNEHSDVKMGKLSGFDTRHYPNVNRNARLFRPYDMSPMVGGAYRGIVDNHIYRGPGSYSMEYEYGFIYGGLFVLGYCAFIHDYCKRNHVDKVLFLSRDGDTLKQAYDYLYPDEETEYVYWSRKAATKLEAGYDRLDYFRRFVFHKVNQGYSIRDALHSMELDFLADRLGAGTRGRRTEGAWPGADEELTDRNAPLLKEFVEANWEWVQQAYDRQGEAAKAYYGKVLSGIRKAAAVDIGWAGSGAMTLKHLVSEEWRLPCEVVGIIAGTNTVHNADPDASEGFLQSGQLEAYLYSQGHNRDLLKRHDLNRGYNVFWELLLSSPTPQFQGFYRKGDCIDALDGTHVLEAYGVTLVFGRHDANQEGIREIQRGILDFVRDYHRHFRAFSYMFRISGRDAYAPMLAAASCHERYLKRMEQRFALEINVD